MLSAFKYTRFSESSKKAPGGFLGPPPPTEMRLENKKALAVAY
jgi:hypothetical protein